MFTKSILIVVLTVSFAYSQNSFNDIMKLNVGKSSYPLKENSGVYSEIQRHFSDSTNKSTVTSTEIRTKKSPGLAMIYSLLVPGLGQLYTKRFDVGKYFLITEAVLWLGFGSFSVYSNWLLNDAYNYAGTHAGVTKGSKGNHDDFWVNIGNYDNVEQYNNDMLQQGKYEKVYYPGTGFDFYWNNVADRQAYREDKLAGDRIYNDRLFIVGAVLINHLVSAVSAIILTNKYNSGQKTSGGFVINADVIRHFSHVDGIRLNLSKWF